MTVDNFWMFNRRVHEINKMDIRSTLYASLHCLKMIVLYNDRLAYCQYKVRIGEEVEVWRPKLANAEMQFNYYNMKLDLLTDRGYELGVEIPETLEDIKKLCNEYKISKKDKYERQPINTSDLERQPVVFSDF